MKKIDIFVHQISIAFVVIFMLNFILIYIFNKDSDKSNFLEAKERVVNLVNESSSLLDNLVNAKEVTFDPTNGERIAEVIKNLKEVSKEKILLIGSSQLITLNDNWSSDRHLQRVDKVLERASSKDIQVYNMSLGGMTFEEKKIVLKKVLEQSVFDKVIVAMTPWDCISSNIRKGVKNLENIKFTKNKVNWPKSNIFNGYAPRVINENISKFLEEKFWSRSYFLNNRSVLKYWVSKNIEEFLFDNNFSAASVVSANAKINSNNRKIDENSTSNEEKDVPLPKSNKIGPSYWTTVGQKLDNLQGWEKDCAHSQDYSLKIVNETGNNSKWVGEQITLDSSTNKFTFGGWSKSHNVINATIYALDFKLEFDDGSIIWYWQNLKFSQNSHGWEQVETTVTFDKKVKSVTPHLLLYGATGIAWFDYIYAKPHFNDEIGSNIILNFDIEEGKKEFSTSKEVSQTEKVLPIFENIDQSTIDTSSIDKVFQEKRMRPNYWTTIGQKLNDFEGWSVDSAHSPNHSLKLVNDEGNNSKWVGAPIVLERSSNKFTFGGWSKCSKITDAKIYGLDFKIEFEDGNSIWYLKNLNFSQGSHGWEHVETTVTFDKKVSAIIPHMLMYGATGEAWFDDVYAKPYYNNKMSDNIIPNFDMEEGNNEVDAAKNVFSPQDWNSINMNTLDLLDFLSDQQKSQNFEAYVLLTPVWHKGKFNAYPQKKHLEEYFYNVKEKCLLKNMHLMNASFLLDDSHFTEYRTGARKGKIDVLHFDSNGHEELANYLIKELEL